MSNFSKTIQSFMPQFVMNEAVFVGGKLIYRMKNRRVFTAYFDNAPHQVPCMGCGNCLWLKITNPSGDSPSGIRVDVASIPFNSIPALNGKRVNTQTESWDYCAPPAWESLREVRETVRQYIEIWS